MMTKVDDFLSRLELEEYSAVFAESAIGIETLEYLSDDDLKEIGVTKLGHRREILAAIDRLGHVTGPSAPVVREIARGAVLPDGERRQVTVLFADISGFTRLSNTLDPEDVQELLNKFFGTVDGLVETHGGSIDKHIGDCVMAVFGAPVAHSNDPERAVRTAMAIHKAVAADTPPIRVHIGIASGQVVASGVGSEAHQEYTITGASVNLASRLQDMAKSGETLISHAVSRSLGADIRREIVGEVDVQGFDARVRVWRIQSDQGGAVAARNALIGREAELRQFRSIVEHCVNSGQGQTVHLRGEAGIGKTHLSDEFETIARAEGFRIHAGHILDFGAGTGQDAIRTILRGLLGLGAADDDAASLDVAIDNAITAGRIDEGRRVYLNDLLGLPQPTSLRAVYDAMDNTNRNLGKRETLAELATSASTTAPLLIKLEDIHWADSIVLNHAARLSLLVADHPIILLLTSRIEGDPIDPGWKAEAGGGSVLTLDLGPLRDADAARLASAFFAEGDRRARSCIERAGGNPLFLEQLLRSAEESDMAEVPGSVQSIVMARMDNLDAHDKRALQAASIMGQHFSLLLLRELIGSPDYSCAGLVEHYLLRPLGDSFMFSHALVREGVYSSLLKSRRRELHLKVAAWYAGHNPILRAEHLNSAENPAAAAAFADAARAEIQAFRFEEALQLLSRGQSVATEPAGLFDMMMLQGESLLEMGRPAESIEVYRRAVETASDNVGRCRALIGLVAGMRVVDDFSEAFEALDKAQEIATAQGLDAELSDIRYYRGSLFFPQGNLEGCLIEHRAALDAAERSGSPEREVRAVSGLGDAHYALGRSLSALGFFRRCVDLSRQHGFGRVAVGSQYMVAWIRMFLMEFSDARSDAAEAIEAARLVGHQRAELLARLVHARCLIETGFYDEAETDLKRGVELTELLGAKRFLPFMYIQIARLRDLRGDPADETARLMRDALDISRETGIGFLGPWVLSTLALVDPDRDAARAALSEAIVLLEGDCVGHNYLAGYPNAIEIARRHEDWKAMERHADALERYCDAEPLPLITFYVTMARALADHGRGKRDRQNMATISELSARAEETGLTAYMSPLWDAAAPTDVS